LNELDRVANPKLNLRSVILSSYAEAAFESFLSVWDGGNQVVASHWDFVISLISYAETLWK
jgi:hypothetical protein